MTSPLHASSDAGGAPVRRSAASGQSTPVSTPPSTPTPSSYVSSRSTATATSPRLRPGMLETAAASTPTARKTRTPLPRTLAVFGLILVVTQIVVIPVLMPQTAPYSVGDLSAFVADMFDFETDAVFNNVRVKLVYDGDRPMRSRIHCVGDTLDPDSAWMYRSCRFANICLDTNTSEFFVVRPAELRTVYDPRTNTTSATPYKPLPGAFSSTSMHVGEDKSMAIGGINPRWDGNGFNQGFEKVRWFPDIRSRAPDKYYQLPSRVLLIPFYSMAGHNVGHLLWDDLLPIFNLMHIFGMVGIDGLEHMILRWKLPSNVYLYGGCEMQRKKSHKCDANMQRFLPLMGVDPKTYSSLDKVTLTSLNGASTHRLQSTVVCAKHALAGIGKLTDHDKNDHGWDRIRELQKQPGQTDSLNVRNVGRGSLLYDFRTYIMYNMGLPIDPPELSEQPMRIVFSMHSSSEEQRKIGFEKQHDYVSRTLPGAKVQRVELAEMDLYDQLALASNTTVFVSAAGGGAMTATFLPRGSTLILYYAAAGGFNFADFKLTGAPAMLDWDLFNNLGYVRTHWLPIESMDTPEGLEALSRILQREWNVIDAMPN